jgi:predicted transposase YbfD/YdcC
LRYPLTPVLVLIVLAKLAGADSPSSMADWISSHERQLRDAFSLSWTRMPHHNTYRRLLEQVIEPEELDHVTSAHLRSLPGVGHSVLIAIDGKTVRGTIDPETPRGEHLLAAYLPDEGIVLMQVAAGCKDNEISAAPALLKTLDLRGKVVAGDAMHTQRQLSVQILAAGGDYLWLVKDNQPTLRADIEQLFTSHEPTVLGGRVPHDFETYRQVEKGHGRQEIRTITVSSELQGYSDWPGLEQVFQLERRRVVTKSGKNEQETVYGLTSLSRAHASPARLLCLSRGYWGIENGLHQRRDVTFREDRTRLTRGHAGRVMATLNNLVIGLLRHAGATNIAQARRWCDAHITLTLSQLPASSIK